MRILLSAALLAAGVLVGATMPGLSGFVRHLLTSAGWPPTGLPFADGAAKEPGAEPDGHGHSHGPHSHSRSEPPHGEAAGEDGRIAMSAEQIESQEIGVARVEGGILARHILVPGTITPDADRIARVPARVVGTVSEMRRRLGDAVRKGEVVAVLDSREVADAKSEYLTALVQAELQKTNFERQQKLLASQAASEATFQSARAAFMENRLRVDLARQKLSALGLDAAEVASAQKRDETSPNASTLRQYELRAPLSGRIVERRVDVGTAVGKEGDPADLYTVADLSSVWIELSVPTGDLAQVAEGARVTVTPSRDRSGRHEEGKVIFVSPLLNAETRAARVVVALPNAGMAWRPGTYVTAEIEIAQDRVAMRVPRSAFQTVEGKRVVFVRRPDGFEARAVELGRSDDDAFEVVSGLNPGEDIAVANSFLLKAEFAKGEAGHDH